MSILNKVKEMFQAKDTELELSEDYVELDTEGLPQKKGKILIKLFTLKEYEDIKFVLDALREGYIIPVINIAPLRDKEMVSLKRAIDKLKKTVEANDGDIAGLTESLLIVTPSFARVHRGAKEAQPQTQQASTELETL